MRYTFTHSIQFKDGKETAAYRSTRWWKTSRGALLAAERHADAINQFYANVYLHALVVIDDQGRFVTNEAW